MRHLFSLMIVFMAFLAILESYGQEEKSPAGPLKTEFDSSNARSSAKPGAVEVADSQKSKAKTDEMPNDVHRSYLQLLKAEKRFPTAASCGQCHPDHFDDWSVSPHAYAMVSPVFNSMHAYLVQRTSGTNGDFCIRCHTPVGMDQEHDIFGSALLRPTPVVEAVTCVVCHRIDKDYGNINARMPLPRGPISDPVRGPNGNSALQKIINSEDFGLVTSEEERGKLVHKKAIRSDVISRSAQCAICHDVNSPTGIRLESAFTEYKNSPASKEGVTCQDCHMNKTPGTVPSKEQRFAVAGRDQNYKFEPIAKVRNSPQDHREGMPTKAKKRTNHMFIGPDYSIVHPGIYPHSVDAIQFTYANRFKKIMTEEAEELTEYLKGVSAKIAIEKQKKSELAALRKATKSAIVHARSDWITFQWWEGWGTPEFEEKLSGKARANALSGVGFPWNDKEDQAGSRIRREMARLILARQFNLLNKAHVERTRILRRALQLGKFEITKNDERGLAFRVDIHNPSNGHAVPTGFDAERVMFLSVIMRDGKGRIIFQSGDRDPNGDVRDLHSAFVHAQAPKDGKWLDASAWKESAGLARRKDDKQWLPDPFLFSLQSRFLSQNIVGGERETVLPLNLSFDPLPFVRPPSMAVAHTGRAGPVRKKFRTIPPLGKKRAAYQVERNQLTGVGPYRIEMKFISQMVPANLVKAISSVGFDYNLSAREVAKRIVFGHRVDSKGTRKGGAVVVWNKTVGGILPGAGRGNVIDFTPTEEVILSVPVADYPFPHTSEEEMAKRRKALSGLDDAGDFMIKTLGPLMPELWPGGVPDGLPMLPPLDELIPPSTDAPPTGELFPPANKSKKPQAKPNLQKSQTAKPVEVKEIEISSEVKKK